MKNVLIYYGEETYLSLEKLKSLKLDYKKKLGDHNLSLLPQKCQAAQIISQSKTLPFLADKRLLVVLNFFSEANKEQSELMHKYLPGLLETTVLVFWEEGLVKGAIFTKVLSLSNCAATKFGKLTGQALTKWIQAETKELGGQINASVANFLIGEVGEDLFRLKNEINKLVNYNAEITIESIGKLVKAGIFANIFEMVDAFGVRNFAKSIKEMHKLLDSGENEMYILSMIVRQFRNIIMIKDLKSQGLKEAEITKQLKLHPFVVKKTLSQAASFSLSELKTIYSKLLETEINIKTGASPLLALDMLVVGLKR